MTYLKLQHTLSYGWIALVMMTAVVLAWTVQQTTADSPQLGDSEHLVTIYDRGQEQTIITKAETVEAALDQADIDLQEADQVEPSRDAELVAKSYNINVYRARPVVVIDGSTQVKVLTAAQSDEAIAAKAGIKLYDEDTSELSRVDNVLTAGGAGLKLEIDRATPFNLNLYGKTFTARSQAATIGEMLTEKGIELGPKDGVTPDAATPLTEGMDVKVWRDGKQMITIEEAIKMPVEEIKDYDREIGYREVRTEGKPGTKQVTYEIVMRGGEEVSRKKITSVVTKQPVKQVIAVGAKLPTVSGSKADWMAAAGISASDYGFADKLISKESGWNPQAVNPSSGACGLVQALPCSKLGPNWYDPVVALRWGDGYVKGRYGSWAGAWEHSQLNGWY